MHEIATHQTICCSKCGEKKLLTSDYFQADKQKSSGFRPDCKICRHAAHATKRPDSVALRNRRLIPQGKKFCSNCKTEKQLSEFHSRKNHSGGVSDRCKSCTSSYTRERRNKDKAAFDAASKEYRARNKDAVRERARVYQNKRRQIDHKFRFRSAVGRLVANFLKRRGKSKKKHSFFEAINYTKEDLVTHIERQFTKGMTWENYGSWHLDHIIPNSSFNYTSMNDDEFKECWSLSNLRPMWGLENLSKSNKILTLL